MRSFQRWYRRGKQRDPIPASSAFTIEANGSVTVLTATT